MNTHLHECDRAVAHFSFHYYFETCITCKCLMHFFSFLAIFLLFYASTHDLKCSVAVTISLFLTSQGSRKASSSSLRPPFCETLGGVSLSLDNSGAVLEALLSCLLSHFCSSPSLSDDGKGGDFGSGSPFVVVYVCVCASLPVPIRHTFCSFDAFHVDKKKSMEDGASGVNIFSCSKALLLSFLCIRWYSKKN